MKRGCTPALAKIDKQKDKAVAMFEGGATIRACAKEFGVSESTMQTWYRKWRGKSKSAVKPPGTFSPDDTEERTGEIMRIAKEIVALTEKTKDSLARDIMRAILSTASTLRFGPPMEDEPQALTTATPYTRTKAMRADWYREAQA